MVQHTLWTEKYRPSTISEYVFHDAKHRDIIEQIVSTNQLPNLLLSGVQGTGKTTIARILIRALGVQEADVLEINASDERGIDTFRSKIKNFATALPIGEFKVVFLEEASELTVDAQEALRHFIESKQSQVRFILTCNSAHRLIPPIRSRLQEIEFKAPNKTDVCEFAAKVLLKEKVKFDLDLLDEYVDIGYPDIRKIVNSMQLNTINSVLQSATSKSGSGTDYRTTLLELIDAGQWYDARMLVCSTAVADEFVAIYRFLYDNLHKTTTFADQIKWEEAIVIIAEHLYKHGLVADPEINLASCIIQLAHISK